MSIAPSQHPKSARRSFRLRHLLLQVLRRGIQSAGLVLILLFAFLGLYHHYSQTRVLDQELARNDLRAGVLKEIDARLFDVSKKEDLLEDYSGNLWSMRLAGFDISDPLAVAEASAASRSVYWPFLLSALVPILIAAAFGRVYCSWLCPGYLLFEVAGKLRGLLRRLGLKPYSARLDSRHKYPLLFAGLVVAMITMVPIFSLVYPPAVISRLLNSLIFGTAIAGMLGILLLIVGIEVLLAPRVWCRSLCPGGAIYALLGRFRPLRVRCDLSRCEPCSSCSTVCEEGLYPVQESSGLECDNCGVCIRHCPTEALGFSIQSRLDQSREASASAAAERPANAPVANASQKL